jgi:hypothetical protein
MIKSRSWDNWWHATVTRAEVTLVRLPLSSRISLAKAMRSMRQRRGYLHKGSPRFRNRWTYYEQTYTATPRDLKLMRDHSSIQIHTWRTKMSLQLRTNHVLALECLEGQLCLHRLIGLVTIGSESEVPIIWPLRYIMNVGHGHESHTPYGGRVCLRPHEQIRSIPKAI